MIEEVEMNMKLVDVNRTPFSYPCRANNMCDIDDLVGKVIKGLAYSDEYFQILTDDCVYAFYHEQDCCEDVWLTQVDGISDKIIGSRIVTAEEVVDERFVAGESVTWTFYKIGTNKGMIDFRFQGESNGYYSESVDLIKIEVSE